MKLESVFIDCHTGKPVLHSEMPSNLKGSWSLRGYFHSGKVFLNPSSCEKQQKDFIFQCALRGWRVQVVERRAACSDLSSAWPDDDEDFDFWGRDDNDLIDEDDDYEGDD